MLQNVAGAAGAERLLGELRIAVHRQDYDLGVLPVDSLQEPKGVTETQTERVDVGDDDVRTAARQGLDELLTVPDRAGDVVVPVDQTAEGLDGEALIAKEKEPNPPHTCLLQRVSRPRTEWDSRGRQKSSIQQTRDPRTKKAAVNTRWTQPCVQRPFHKLDRSTTNFDVQVLRQIVGADR